MWIVTLLLFVLILGIIVLVHEFGHFIWAKIFKVHIYEFSIGMGPKIFSKKGKDKIDYSIRAFPIGGFVSMAGEVYADDDKVKKEDLMCNKPWYARTMILLAGVINNFILALLLLFVYALIWGATPTEPIVGEVLENYPAAQAGLKAGDEIIKINGQKVSSWDAAQLVLVYKNNKGYTEFEVLREGGTTDIIKVSPIKEADAETGEERMVFGFSVDTKIEKGFIPSLKFAFAKFGSVFDSMKLTIKGLFTGKISLNSLSGPVGIYQVVDQGAKLGISYIIYLIAFLSINVGFINVLPFPAFDGGRVLFIIIEKIKGSPINAKIENAFHTIGFLLLMALMIYITYRDILNLFIK